MLKKGILLLAAVFVLIGATADARRRDIVVPTWYGYGVVNAQAVARPYITGYYPYAWPAYGYAGMHPTAPAPVSAAWSGSAPAWNGSGWYYSSGNSVATVVSNLNIRSTPHITGRKNRNANVIGSLNAGEYVYILGQNGNWSLIQSAYAPLRRGYVYTDYLRSSSVAQSQYTAFYPQRVAGW
jgi:hypothetical protein